MKTVTDKYVWNIFLGKRWRGDNNLMNLQERRHGTEPEYWKFFKMFDVTRIRSQGSNATSHQTEKEHV